MKQKRAIITAALALAALATLAIGAGPANAAAPAVAVFNATPAAGTPNVPSNGLEATGGSEFGDAVTFDGTARTLNLVTVTMSSWACQTGSWSTHDCGTTPGATFSVPLTLSIYDAPVTLGNATVVPGALIARVTKTFNMPYRPSANLTHCNASNNSLGKWYSPATATCYNGRLANVNWNFTSLNLQLPDTAVIGVAYNTTHYGYNPIGESTSCFSTSAGCGYDALNVGTNGSVSVGTKPYPDTAFQNSQFGGQYCDSTPTPGVFNLDSPTNACWAGFNPAIKVTAH